MKTARNRKVGLQWGMWLCLICHSSILFIRFFLDHRDLWKGNDFELVQRSDIKTTTIGRHIVEKSFSDSYSAMVKFCSGEPELEGNLKYFTFLKCLEKFVKYRQHANYTSIKKKEPWWFDTMLRDSRDSNLHGVWHLLFFPDPALRMCVMEKGGSKQWRQVHCLANNATPELTGCIPFFESREDESQHGVFLRDPLDRFLSGFLDRCATSFYDKHCEPLSVFMDPATKLTGNFVGRDQRKLFEIFVETMPLKWNFHFYPQSFYCGGLYRYIDQYDFVGSMGTSFYSELTRFSNQYPKYEPSVRKIFPERNLTLNVGTETKAAQRVKEFYTPRTLRRVLEYMAIDYILLNISIPVWAEEMLASDTDDDAVGIR